MYSMMTKGGNIISSTASASLNLFEAQKIRSEIKEKTEELSYAIQNQNAQDDEVKSKEEILRKLRKEYDSRGC